MHGRRRLLIPLLLAVALATAWPLSALAASQPPLGTAANFAVLAGSTITNTGASAVNGDLGVSPGTAVTGFPPGTLNGAQHLNDAVALQAQNDLTTAYNNAAGQAFNTDLSGADLAGRILTPGTYHFGSSAQLTGALTLSGSGVYIFQIGSTLVTASGSSVVLTNGATSCAVFWQVGSSATLGTVTSFQGTVMAQASITMTTGASLTGRALARTGAVTLDTNAITTPAAGCASGGGGGGGGIVCGNDNSDNNSDNETDDNNRNDNTDKATANAKQDEGGGGDDNNNHHGDNDNKHGKCHFGPFKSGSTDSGTCGPDWANDTFNRSFTIHQNPDGTFTVREDFSNGRFTTIAGSSPGACESSTPHGTLVAAGVKGTFHGYLAGTVTAGNFNQSGCDSGGCDSTAGFITHLFGPSAKFSCSTGVGACSFLFTYRAHDQGLKFRHWVNASVDLGGNRGDIATS